jgi:hypothetical protein
MSLHWIWNRLPILWIFWIALASCDSGSSIADPDPPPARVVQFRKLLEREVPPFPSGVAVTPDGRWLVSLGFREGTVSLYDATTLELVVGPVRSIPCSAPFFCEADRDSIFLTQPHAAVVSPDGSMVVVTSRAGFLWFSLPSLELLFAPPGIGQRSPPRYGIRDRAGENYYFNGEENDVVRVTVSDESQALFSADVTEGIALSRDERDLLVLTDSGRRLQVLGTPDLELRRSIDLPLSGVAVVPLKSADQAIILGGATGAGQTSAQAPLMALSVNVATGSVGSPEILCCEGLGSVDFLFGDGNQWTEVGEATTIVPTSLGTVTIDTNIGTVTLHSAGDLESEFPPGFDIAAYPDGQRIVLADAPGRLIVYEVEEETLSTGN